MQTMMPSCPLRVLAWVKNESECFLRHDQHQSACATEPMDEWEPTILPLSFIPFSINCNIEDDSFLIPKLV